MSYQACILFKLTYGVSDNQVGIWIPPLEMVDAGMPEGPLRFLMNKNREIYIADSINKKIKKFDIEGNLLFSTMTIEDMDDIIIDENDCIYVRWGARCDHLTKLDETGRVIYTESIDPGLIGTWECIKDDPDLLFQNKRDNAGKKYQFLYVGRKYQYGVKQYDTGGQLEREFKVGTGRIRKHSPTNGTTTPGPDFKGVDTIYDWSVDGNGNFYGWGEVIRKDPIVIKEGFEIVTDVLIFKYNSKRKFVCQVQFPGTPGNFLRDPPFQVDAEGNIYCLQFQAQHLEIVRYEEI